jgi:hypothetical protein
MVKVRTLVPLTHPKTDELFAAGAEVDVADEVAADWRADGKVSLIADEQAAEKAAKEGNYSARTARSDAPKDEESPPPTKGKS